MIVDSATWTGRWREPGIYLPGQSEYMLDYTGPFENSRLYKPRPDIIVRLLMRFLEHVGPWVGSGDLAEKFKARRHDWMRPYLRTGAVWWRPIFQGTDAFEMIDTENGGRYIKQFGDHNNAIWFDREAYVAWVIWDLGAGKRRRKKLWQNLSSCLRNTSRRMLPR